MLAASPLNLDVNSHPVGPNSNYSMFISDGFVSLLGSEKQIPVKILRDTGASESFILDSVLPFFVLFQFLIGLWFRELS